MAGVQIHVKHDIESMIRRLNLAKRQLPFVASRAINATGLDVKADLTKRIGQNLDNPTRYTRNALYFRYSNKANLTASVRLKDVLQSGTRMTHEQRLGHLFVKGGARNFTGFEGWLLRAGYLQSGEYIVPTKHAKRDGYGNVSRGLLVKVMSQLRLGADPLAWKSNSARSKRSRKAGRIFWSTGNGSMASFSPGIWMDTGRAMMKLFAVAGRPSYRVRVDMARIVPGIARARFPVHFEAEAMRVMSEPGYRA